TYESDRTPNASVCTGQAGGCFGLRDRPAASGFGGPNEPTSGFGGSAQTPEPGRIDERGCHQRVAPGRAIVQYPFGNPGDHPGGYPAFGGLEFAGSAAACPEPAGGPGRFAAMGDQFARVQQWPGQQTARDD